MHMRLNCVRVRVHVFMEIVGGAEVPIIDHLGGFSSEIQSWQIHKMLEVCSGLLLGSMGDALAVFTRVPSVVVQYQVTHVLSLCNERPEWMEKLAPEGSGEGSDSEKELEAVEEEEEAGESGATKGNAGTSGLSTHTNTISVRV